jgi:hypothetical protein
MGKFLGINFGKNDNVLKEEIKAFHDKGRFNRGLKTIENQRGEGWESLSEIPGFSNVQVQGFNLFYNTHINKNIENELHKMRDYRLMAAAPEIQDVIEDAVNESTQEDEMGNVFHLNIIDKELQNNENIVRNLKREFNELFNERIDMKEKAWDLLFSYYVDGRSYYERVIDISKPKNGIINIKKLPAETMDYYYDPLSGRNVAFVQYLQPNFKKPADMGEAKKMDGKELVFFDPDQIGFFDYGIYGRTKHEIIGYLDKARIPYNQLKLLETAVIIMRIVRAPQRYVFKIDTGNMPRDKSLKFVEKVAQKMKKKQSYDPATGQLTNTPDVLSILDNFFLPTSPEGRGSSIDTIGGDTAGMYGDLADVNYFQSKLYRALKYPASRVHAMQEGNDSDSLFGGTSTGSISRDEVKWAKFLEKQQMRLCSSLLDTFLIHLEFRDMKKQYELNNKKISITMNPPSHYKEQMIQQFNDSRFANYSQLADREEFSKIYLQRRYLKWSDEEIKDNQESMKEDVKYGIKKEEDQGY